MEAVPRLRPREFLEEVDLAEAGDGVLLLLLREDAAVAEIWLPVLDS